jgi:glycosyltransferase involved in cell wall biosynthesis
MKIAIVSPAHPLRGGIAALSERLALALQESGHEVEVFSFSLQYPAFLFPGKTQFTDDPPPAGLRIHTCINAVNPLNWWRVGRQLARFAPDRVVVRFWLPFMGPCLGSVLRVFRLFDKKKATITGLVDNIVPHEKRFGDRPFAQYFTGSCNDFLVMSKAVGDDIGTFTSKPVRFAPHPIYDSYGDAVPKEAARAALNIPQEEPLVLFFGLIRAYKGLDLLLESLPDAPNVHVAIAGEPYESWQPYADIIEANDLHARVHLFTDFIPNDQVRYFFSAADLVVQPYKTATQSGISQIAYHFEKPMLVTNVGGLPEIVANGVSGYVVSPGPAAIAAAMCDFFDQNRAAAMVAGVKEEKKRFGWGHFLETLLG